MEYINNFVNFVNTIGIDTMTLYMFIGFFV